MKLVIHQVRVVLARVPEKLFVHDRIYNSVADYRSSRVGVGCMSDVGCRMSDGVWRMSPLFFFHDGITFERFELQS